VRLQDHQVEVAIRVEVRGVEFISRGRCLLHVGHAGHQNVVGSVGIDFEVEVLDWPGPVVGRGQNVLKTAPPESQAGLLLLVDLGLPILDLLEGAGSAAVALGDVGSVVIDVAAADDRDVRMGDANGAIGAEMLRPIKLYMSLPPGPIPWGGLARGLKFFFDDPIILFELAQLDL